MAKFDVLRLGYPTFDDAPKGLDKYLAYFVLDGVLIGTAFYAEKLTNTVFVKN